jgi:CheY-like chemotaxis protein
MARSKKSTRRIKGAGMIIVLYVDADPKMYPIISHIFERTGNIVVFPAGSGEEALAWSSRHRADVIVSEVHLRGIDGTELLHILRSRGISAPFIFFTRCFTESLEKKACFPDVFRFNGKNGPDKKTIMKLLRIVYWVTGDSDTGASLRTGSNG